jgi:AraC family transcriptional regulator
MQWALTGVTPADSMYLESLCLLAVLELCVIQKERWVAAAQPAGSLTRSNEQKVADYVEANLDRNIGLNDLAQLAGLSRFHFLRAFKKTTAETPYQYLLRRRIERAQALLTEGSLSVTEIASAVGFKDSTQFIRTFRTKVGVTPGKYRG